MHLDDLSSASTLRRGFFASLFPGYLVPLGYDLAVASSSSSDLDRGGSHLNLYLGSRSLFPLDSVLAPAFSLVDG